MIVINEITITFLKFGNQRETERKKENRKVKKWTRPNALCHVLLAISDRRTKGTTNQLTKWLIALRARDCKWLLFASLPKNKAPCSSTIFFCRQNSFLFAYGYYPWFQSIWTNGCWVKNENWEISLEMKRFAFCRSQWWHVNVGLSLWGTGKIFYLQGD